jgi:DNA-binding response OmpR family regulator
MTDRILVIHEDTSSANTLRRKLIAGGFAVALAPDVQKALKKHATFHPDLVVLDLTSSGPNGVEVCTNLNAGRSRSGVIVLTENHRKKEGLEGLRLGADDCLIKPVAFEELLIRINAVLRRIRREPHMLTLGSVCVDFTHYAARRGNQNIVISTREIDVLRYMNARAGEIVTRDDLLRNVWGYGDPPVTRCVDHLICRLRRKVEPNPASPQYIQAVYADGYRLVVD